MATNTSNYQLVKIALSDSPPDITAMNPNWDKIDEEMKKNADSAKVAQTYETAGGTGTAVTIPSFEFTDGISRTFVASAANNGAATTLNGKPLYKPGTTTSPKIVAGKAYTVWYSTTGGCFFLKASAEGTAVAANVLAGTTFSNDDDTGIPGEMVDMGPSVAETVNLTTNNQEYTIAEGKHSGLRKIKAVITNLAASVIKAGTTVGGVLGTFTSDANAVAAEMLAGVTAYVNGIKITGTMANIGKAVHSLAINGSYTIPKGYHDGTGVVSQALPTKGSATITPGTAAQVISAGQYLTGDQTIAGDADLISANIKAGKNIFGVAGNSNVVDTSAGDATAAQILSGKKAYVDGALITGNIPSKAAATITPSTVNQLISAGQYLSGVQTILGSANLVPENIKDGVNIFNKVGNYSAISDVQDGAIKSAYTSKSTSSRVGIEVGIATTIFNSSYNTNAALIVMYSNTNAGTLQSGDITGNKPFIVTQLFGGTQTGYGHKVTSFPLILRSGTNYIPQVIIYNPDRADLTLKSINGVTFNIGILIE